MSRSKTRAWAGARSAPRPVHRTCCALCVATFGALLCAPSFATLGDSAASIPRDHAALHGTALTRTPAGAFEVDDIVTRDGIQVRQYVSPSGIVFASTWSGRSLPDLKVLLGPHYYRYVAEVAAANSNSKAVSLNTGELVVQIVKLPRGFTGSALLPALLPPGTSAGDLR